MRSLSKNIIIQRVSVEQLFRNISGNIVACSVNGTISFKDDTYIISVNENSFPEDWRINNHDYYIARISLVNYKEVFKLNLEPNSFHDKFEIIKDDKYKMFQAFILKESLEDSLRNKDKSKTKPTKI